MPLSTVTNLAFGEAGLHRPQPKATGRSNHDPGDVPRLYLNVRFNRTRSSRRLEGEAIRNVVGHLATAAVAA